MTEKKIEYLQTLQEEIEFTLGLNPTLQDSSLQLDTIAGTFTYKTIQFELMIDVYRFLAHYGAHLYRYGQEQVLILKD